MDGPWHVRLATAAAKAANVEGCTWEQTVALAQLAQAHATLALVGLFVDLAGVSGNPVKLGARGDAWRDAFKGDR